MIAPTPALAPSDDVAVILQAAGFGALIGSVIAARRRAADPQYDAWLLTVRWSVLFAVGGTVIVATRRLGWW